MIPTTARNAVAAHGREALSIHNAKAPKYHLMSGGMYLNQSAAHLQHGREYAWKGTMDQVRACRRTFAAAVGCRAVAIQPFPTLSGSVEA